MSVHGIRRSPFLGIVILVFAVIASGCVGTHYNTKTVNGHKTVTRVDEEGSKTIVYEVHKDGSAVIHDESDPMAQQYLAEKRQAEQARVDQETRQNQIRKARKRKPTDPIYVVLLPTELGANLAKAQHSEGAVFEQIRKEFKDDPVIRLVSKEDLRRHEWSQIGKVLAGTSPSRGPAADITVTSNGDLKEVVGISRSTGKPAKGIQIVLEAKVSSNYLPAEYSVKETGNVFNNVEMTSRFAAQIKEIIKKRIGPDIPADRSL
jgi:hypothetical protein